jgi:hypothetical protein
VDLIEIDVVGLQLLEAAGAGSLQLGGATPAMAALCGDDGFVATTFESPAQHAFGVAATVAFGGVEEVHPLVQSRVHRSYRIPVVLRSPILVAGERPAAQRHHRNLHAGVCKFSVLHGPLIPVLESYPRRCARHPRWPPPRLD